MTEHDEPDLQPDEVRLLARQIDGWACIRCGSAPGIDKPMKPAGIVDGRQVFWCATDCKNATADNIPVEVAAHTLFVFGRGGWPASGFKSTLLLAIAQADAINRESLAKAFPEYVAAYNLAQNAQDGLARLQAILDEDDEK